MLLVFVHFYVRACIFVVYNYIDIYVYLYIWVGEGREKKAAIRRNHNDLLKMNEIDAAVEDLDVIRERADLPLLAEINPGISGEALLEEVFIQRRKELFTEWGHRWFDLKRSGNINTVSRNNPTWEMTDSFYPIPSEEISKNPNLIQNDGY